MYIKRHVVTITTDAEGAGVGYTPDVNGVIQAIRYVKSGSETAFADTVDFDIIAETSGLVILDKDNVTASTTFHPRGATCDTSGVASLYAADGEPVESYLPVADERVKISVANGGALKVGVFHVYVGG